MDAPDRQSAPTPPPSASRGSWGSWGDLGLGLAAGLGWWLAWLSLRTLLEPCPPLLDAGLVHLVVAGLAAAFGLCLWLNRFLAMLGGLVAGLLVPPLVFLVLVLTIRFKVM